MPPHLPRRRRDRGIVIASSTTGSAHGLADAEHVALAVAEPRTTLADSVLARVVAGDLGDSPDRPHPGEVDFLEHDAAALQRGDRGVDVVDLPGHLRERPRRRAG